MQQQLELFSSIPSEEWVYNELLDSLKDVVYHNGLASDWLRIERGRQFSSVWFGSQMVFRICCRGTHNYFSVANAYCDNLNDCIRCTSTTDGSTQGFTNFIFTPSKEGLMVFTDFLSGILDQAIDRIPKEYDCCSRFNECSDAKRCIHPNPSMAAGCGYRKVMKKGRIYYGKNRNL